MVLNYLYIADILRKLEILFFRYRYSGILSQVLGEKKILNNTYTVKKGDIPAGEGKMANLFYSVLEQDRKEIPSAQEC